jgi:anti-sigma-K factor RskA
VTGADTHEFWDELAAGYALHALEPDEEIEFTTHLLDCDRCRTMLDEHELVAAQLGSLAEGEDVAPPSWQRIRQGVVPATTPTVVELDRHRRPALSRRLLAAAAGVIVLAGVGVAGWQLSDGGSPKSSNVALIESCDAASDCIAVPLQVKGESPATLVVRDGAARMVPTGLAQPPADHAYALWQLPRNGRPVLMAEMEQVPGGPSGPIAMTLPYADTAAFAVSLEPVDVVPDKPTQVLAVGIAA